MLDRETWWQSVNPKLRRTQTAGGHTGQIQDFLPFARPAIGDAEIQAVTDCLRTGWLTTGPVTREFERRFADCIGVRHALAVNSCTAAMHLALEAAGVGEGDKVITTPYTFTATAEVIRYLGGEVVFCDVDPATLNISPVELEKLSESVSDVKGVVPVHFAGQACDMDAILELSRRKRWFVVEDAAHALPARYGERNIGTIGDLTAFSFYATKTLVTGEGGMVTTDSDEYAERIRTMRLHGINRDIFDRYSSQRPSWYYEVVAPGFKYNLTDLASAIGLVQLERLDELCGRRESIASLYIEGLKDLPVRVLGQKNPGDKHAWHLFVILLDLDAITISRDQFIELMALHGIGTSVHFIPLHIHPYWKRRYGFEDDDYPVAFSCYRRAVSLPIYPDMSDRDANRVIATIQSILRANMK